MWWPPLIHWSHPIRFDVSFQCFFFRFLKCILHFNDNNQVTICSRSKWSGNSRICSREKKQQLLKKTYSLIAVETFSFLMKNLAFKFIRIKIKKKQQNSLKTLTTRVSLYTFFYSSHFSVPISFSFSFNANKMTGTRSVPLSKQPETEKNNI